jgi:hypothetical protein
MLPAIEEVKEEGLSAQTIDLETQVGDLLVALQLVGQF